MIAEATDKAIIDLIVVVVRVCVYSEQATELLRFRLLLFNSFHMFDIECFKEIS